MIAYGLVFWHIRQPPLENRYISFRASGAQKKRCTEEKEHPEIDLIAQ